MSKNGYFPSEKAFRSMLPGKIAMTAILVANANGISHREALSRFYGSPTYARLEDEASKSWWESPQELCRDFSLDTSSAHTI